MERGLSVPYIFSLVEGVLVALSGFVTIILANSISSVIGIGFIPLISLGIIGLTCGIVIIWLSYLIKKNNKEENIKKIGTLILIFTLVSIFNGGGFIIGFILGIIASAGCLSWKQPQTNIEQVQ